MLIDDRTALLDCLSDAQARRDEYVKCELTSALSARMSDAALLEALVTGLPMAQGVQHRILRSRGRGVTLTAKLRYREGVRMLAYWQQAGAVPYILQDEERIGLARACDVAVQAVRLQGDAARFRFVYDWVCRNIRYVNTAPGRKGYERLVGAGGAMLHHQANCQGFADVLYLLCGLCGVRCEYRCGRGVRRLHLWNAVCLDGVWQDADASKGARKAGQSPGEDGLVPQFPCGD